MFSFSFTESVTMTNTSSECELYESISSVTCKITLILMGFFFSFFLPWCQRTKSESKSKAVQKASF